MENNWREKFDALFGGLTYPFDSAENKQREYDNERTINFIESLLAEQKHDYEILVNTILEGHKKELAEQKKELMEEIYAKDKIAKLNHD